MNRVTLLTLFTLMLTIPLFAAGYEFESDHYRVTSEVSTEDAESTAYFLEAMMSLYNDHFHFEVDELPDKLRIRIFASKARYDTYLRRLINETRDGFVYLHYGDVAKNELVGYASTSDAMRTSLIHQSFVQYFRSFVPEPPLWLREGFAVFFEASTYDPDFDAAIYKENVAWLDTLKSIMDGSSREMPLTLEELLTIDLKDARDRIDVFYPQAWGLVSFLLNSTNPDVNRILWDAISALSPTADIDANEEAVIDEAFRWVAEDALVEDFLAYVGERRSFRGWVEFGIGRYNASDLDAAEEAFVKALKLEKDNYVPQYYLGLINYERQNYGLADYYYQAALKEGADEPVTLYALGVNAYADNRFEDAVSYLEMTVERGPEFRDRAEDLLIRIRG